MTTIVPRFVPKSTSCATFDKSVDAATRHRLRGMWNRLIVDTEQKEEWRRAEDEARERATQETCDKIVCKCIVRLIEARCSGCEEKVTYTLPENTTMEGYMLGKVKEAFAKYRPWARNGREYVPSDGEATIFLRAIESYVFRRDKNGFGIHCPNVATTCANESVSFDTVTVKRIQRLIDKDDEKKTSVVAQKRKYHAQEEEEEDGNGTQKQKKDEIEEKMENDDDVQVERTKKKKVRRALMPDQGYSAKEYDVTGEYKPLTPQEAQALPFGHPRCLWMEIKQQAGTGFHIMFVRWTGNEHFVMKMLQCIDSVTSNAQIGNAKEQQFAARYRSQYMFNLAEDRLINYKKVLERTESCRDYEGYADHQIHHFAHVITFPFRKEMLHMSRNRTVLQLLQWTHTQWAQGLDEHLKRKYEAEYEQQQEAHRARRAAAAGAVSLIRGSAIAAPIVSKAYRSQIDHTRKMETVNAYHKMVRSVYEWMWTGCSDEVRCSPVSDGNGMGFPPLFYTLPFMFYLHAYCDLVENGAYEEARIHLHAVFANSFDCHWKAELQTLYMLALPEHVKEHCKMPRNLVGHVRSARPYTLYVTHRAISEIEGFLKINDSDQPMLRQMLAGTRLRLCLPAPPLSSHVSQH